MNFVRSGIKDYYNSIKKAIKPFMSAAPSSYVELGALITSIDDEFTDILDTALDYDIENLHIFDEDAENKLLRPEGKVTQMKHSHYK